jgi:hypothetical protein
MLSFPVKILIGIFKATVIAITMRGSSNSMALPRHVPRAPRASLYLLNFAHKVKAQRIK